jgi:hypothetical protein
MLPGQFRLLHVTGVVQRGLLCKASETVQEPSGPGPITNNDEPHRRDDTLV